MVEVNMKLGNLLLGVGIGAAVGYLVAKQFNDEAVTPEMALKKVKTALQQSDATKIIGSWIQTQTEKIDKFGLPYEVYNGGVSFKDQQSEKQYNFRIDAKTGAILELDSK
jgi:predicted small secreted protein